MAANDDINSNAAVLDRPENQMSSNPLSPLSPRSSPLRQGSAGQAQLPPELTSPDGIALIHTFISYLKDPAKPKTYEGFIVETSGQFSRPLTVNELANGLFDIVFTKDIGEIVANIDEIEQKLGQAEKDAKSVREPSEYHKPLDTNDIEELRRKPSYQGSVAVLDIYLDRARARKFYDSTAPDLLNYREEAATWQYRTSVQKAFQPFIDSGAVSKSDVANVTAATLQVIGQEHIATPQQLIDGVAETIPGGIPPQLVTLLTETMTPPFFEQIRDPIVAVQHIRKVNETIQQFKTKTEELVQDTLTLPKEPATQAAVSTSEPGGKKSLRATLDKKITELSRQGIITQSLRDQLLEKSTRHIQGALYVYASAKEQKDLQQAVHEAFTKAVHEVALPQSEQIFSQIRLDDPEDPLITSDVENTLDALRAFHLLPDAAEGEKTEEVIALLQKIKQREAISGEQTFGQEILDDLQQSVELRPQKVNGQIDPSLPAVNSVMALVGQNEFLATQEAKEEKKAPFEPLTSAIVEENVQAEAAALRAGHQNLDPEEAKKWQEDINHGLQLAQFLRVAEADPKLSKWVLFEFFTDFEDIQARLGQVIAAGDTAKVKVYQAILTYHREHQNELLEFLHDQGRHKYVHEVLRPFGLKGWQDSSVFINWMNKELDEKYGHNIPKWFAGQEKLMHRWLYFKKREGYLRFANIALTNGWLKAFASDDVVGKLVATARNKVLIASGKWIYKSSKKTITFAARRTVVPVAKRVGGPLVGALKAARVELAASKHYGFLAGRLKTPGKAIAAVGRFARAPITGTKRAISAIDKRIPWVGKLSRLTSKGFGQIFSKIINPIAKILFLLSAIKFVSKLSKKVAAFLGAYLYGLLLWMQQFMFMFYAAAMGAAIGGLAGAITGIYYGAIAGAAVGTAICGPICTVIGGTVGSIAGGVLGFFGGAALMGSLAAAMAYTLQFFVLPHLTGAVLGTGIALGIGLAVGGWWLIPLVVGGFYLGALVQYGLEKFFGSTAGLKTEIAVSNATHNPRLLQGVSKGNIGATKAAAGEATASSGVGGPGLPAWASNPLVASGIGTTLIVLIPTIFILLQTINQPEENRTYLKLKAPSTVPNATAIPYTLTANFPSCSNGTVVENPLPIGSALGTIEDPQIKTGGVITKIDAVASNEKIVWTVTTKCSAPGQQNDTAVSTASLVSLATPLTFYSLTSDFCQAANPQGCSTELKATFESAADWASIPAAVVAGIANQEWKATFKHTNDEIVTWSKSGEKREPNGPTNHPRFIDGCAKSFAFAEGPMQFLTGKDGRPNVWASYQSSSALAGIRQQGYQGEACNVLDAIFGASKKLKSNSGVPFTTKKEQWAKEDVYNAAKAYLGACVPNYNPSLNYCEGVWQYYRTFTPRKL